MGEGFRPANLPEEQTDPVGSVQRMRALADQDDVQLVLGPAPDFAVNLNAAMAPYVDLFILQVQRVQTELDTVRSFIVPTVQTIRQVNPDIEISMQIGATGEVAAIIELVRTMQDYLDSVSILTDHQSLDFVEVFIEELRPVAVLPTPVSAVLTVPTTDSPLTPTSRLPPAKLTTTATVSSTLPSSSSSNLPTEVIESCQSITARMLMFLVSGIIITALTYLISYFRTRYIMRKIYVQGFRFCVSTEPKSFE